MAVSLLTLAGGILFATIISGVSYWLQKNSDMKNLEIRAQQMSDQLSYIFEILLNKGDLSSAQRIVENTATDPGVLFVVIVDADLKVLASSQRDLLGLPLSQYQENPELSSDFKKAVASGKAEFAHHPERGHFWMVAPIMLFSPSRSSPFITGAVSVVFRDDPLIWNPRQSFLRHFWLAFFLTIFAIIILHALLRRWVTSPLQELTRASERLATGELGIQIPDPSSKNEIGILTESFNMMSASLAIQRDALQASEERYLRIFHSSPSCLILVDPGGRIVDVNASFLRQMEGRLDPADWIGRPMTEAPMLQVEELQPEIEDLLKKGAPFKRWKMSVLLHKNRLCFFNLSGIPLFDSQQRMAGAIISAEDITSQQNLEAQLAQAQRMESLGVLAGGIAHDFNNLLTGILGYASLLKTRISSEDPNHAAVAVIEKSSLRARSLVQQLMGFARGAKSAKSVVDINSLILEIFFLLEKSAGKGIAIKTDLDAASPKMLGDSGQIHQALMNLCMNSCDAMAGREGTLLIRTRSRLIARGAKGTPEAPWVEITVQDTGIGMRPEILPRIFEPFFTTKAFGKGTGLGLSVTYGIVKEHGGELTVHSEPGKGSSFTVLFPMWLKEPADTPKQKEERKKEPVLDGRERTALIVDDEKSVLELAKRILLDKNFQVFTAGSGEEGIEIYEKEGSKISLVVLDLLMPGIGGWKTYKRLQALNPAVKVLFTTGYAGSKEFEREIGDLPYLKKPYRIQEFLDAVGAALG